MFTLSPGPKVKAANLHGRNDKITVSNQSEAHSGCFALVVDNAVSHLVALQLSEAQRLANLRDRGAAPQRL